ncbi:hypothetical protein GIB67_026432 [Kingdonia uniflora]|uniref:CASP-like protein n=1 Tax=Kingdonia uniflora TaxID=39325 RepID=A0A7J7P728_9MAGN|nr:hypothetical protein GIB67_026432 [Kingdonia uniflora]
MMMSNMEKRDKDQVVLGEIEGLSGNTTVRTAETVLRIFPMALCVAALVVMLKNAQSNDYGAVSYDDLGGFRYLVYANGLCAAYSFFSAFYTVVPRPASMGWAWTLFFFDQILTYAILAAGAVSAEVMYLAHNGDEAITWAEACSTYGGFCRKATTSVVITFTAVACYVLLSLISSYRLFKNYDAPISYPVKNVEVAVFAS